MVNYAAILVKKKSSGQNSLLNLSTMKHMSPITHSTQKVNHTLESQLLKKVLDMKEEEKYNQPEKPLQTKTVMSLVRSLNVVLLAGTGLGKSCILEIYFDLFPKNLWPVFIVLNPLDFCGQRDFSHPHIQRVQTAHCTGP
ncbi:uncharacterized protein VP01_2562g2 [Puccinia sorghi]|uniref:Uncharacterized protein n=1 Tax=Puccinia sorghi TaxID=27349 RepID=A0A0L6V516_9BASI|nr:uncharacterized protein VP01_2562g2 [Puccinia sorghi]